MRLVPEPDRLEPPHHRHQERAAVDHRGVDHLALARTLRLEQAAHDPEREEHGAAAEVADEVDRWSRLRTLATEVRERAGERDVVDVVAGGLRVRTVLAPAGHAPVDQLRVPREADVGADAEPLGDAGTEPLRAARRPIRRVAARSRRRRDASGRHRSSAGRGTAPRGWVSRSRPSPVAPDRCARRRRPCRRAACRRTGPARSPRARRSSHPAVVPSAAVRPARRRSPDAATCGTSVRGGPRFTQLEADRASRSNSTRLLWSCTPCPMNL